MESSKRYWISFILLLVLAAPVVWVMILKQGKHYSQGLPILFERELDPNGDTLYHTIEDFRLINQNGDTVRKKDFDSSILVVNFFFASCPDICPTMNNNLRFVVEKFDKHEDVKFISHTVDPENDSVPVLNAYSKKLGANAPKWSFLTGSKKIIYGLAEFSYRVPGLEGASHAGFAHSEKFVLVDKEGRVRGVFNGILGMNENNKLIDAINVLRLEYKNPDAFKR